MTLVPVPPGPRSTDDPYAAGGRTFGRGWPHPDTATALAFAEAGGWTWLVVDADGAVVGECGTKAPPTDDGVVEIGYGLAGPSRGQGLGTRAVATLVRWLELRPDVSRVEAWVALDNVASQRLLERLGFTLAETGDDEVGYALSAADGSGQH